MQTITTIAYTTIWGGKFLAMITDGEITHVPDGDWNRAFTSDRIDYVTSAGERYVAKFENGQFRHAPNGDFTQAHTSKYLNYQDWDGQSHFATLEGNLFTMSSPQGDINTNNLKTPTIAYTTIWGGKFLAMITDGEITHVPDGDWSRAFTSDRIDYVTSTGDRFVATFENGQFRHAPDGDFTQAHTSKGLNYQDWDGQSHFATLAGNLFTMSLPQGNININNYHETYGTVGNDTIRGSAVIDYIDAGPGDDVVRDLDAGDDVIIAGAGDDFIDVAHGDNVIIAGAGDDYIDVSHGDNVIMAGAGDDHIRVYDGNNVIVAGAGDDYINAGLGTQTVTGGEGADKIFLNQLSASDHTIITDFWGNDQILVSEVFGEGLPEGKNIAVNETFNLGSRSGFRYLQSTGQLFYDSDGGDFSSGGQLIVTITNKPSIETFNQTGIFIEWT